jgi:hypothetical protein
MGRRAFLALAAAVTIAGCAKHPDAIAPAYISHVPYQSWNCAQLGEEQMRLSSALAAASQQQENTRGNDVVGIILLGAPLGSMSGGNIAPEVARLKGEAVAVERAQTLRSCAGAA